MRSGVLGVRVGEGLGVQTCLEGTGSRASWMERLLIFIGHTRGPLLFRVPGLGVGSIGLQGVKGL